jgi:RNA polymerase sigma-70 factor, ECF subfamily
MTDEPSRIAVGTLDPLPNPTGEAFYAEYFPRLVRMLRPLCPDLDTAQDIAQETLVGVWERPELLDPARPAWPWLRTVARRKAIDHSRGTARRTRIIHERLRPTSDAAVEPAHRIVERDALRQAMRDVPERHRTALGLSHVLDWSPEQIADHLGVKKNAADQLLHRARRSLRRSYERTCAALWLLWPGRWRTNQRVLDTKAVEVGLAGAPVLERTLAVVVAAMVAVGSAVASGGMVVARGAMQPPAATAPAEASVPSEQVLAEPAPPSDVAAVGPAPTAAPATELPAEPSAPVTSGRTVIEVDSAAVQPDKEPPTEARTSAGTDEEGVVVENELRSRLPIHDDPGHEESRDDTDMEGGGGGGAVLTCEGETRERLCEAVDELP